MTRRRRLLLAALLAPPALGLLAVLGVLAWLSSPGGGRAVAERIEAAAADRGIELELGGLRIHPLSLAAEVERLGLAVPGGTKVRLAAGGARVHLDGWGLLAGRVLPREVLLDTLDLQVDAGPPRKEPLALDVSILRKLRRVRVGRGILRWADRTVPFSLDVRGIRAEGSRPPGGGLAGTLAAAPFRLRVGRGDGAREVVLEEVALEWVLRGGRLEVPEFRASRGAGSARGSLGVTFLPDHLEIAGSAEVRADLARLLPGEAEGALAAEARFRARVPGDWSVTARVLPGDSPVRFAGREVRGLSATLEASRGRAVVRDVRGGVSGLGDLADLAVTWTRDEGWQGAGTVDLDLAGLAEGHVPAGIPVSGRVHARMRVSGEPGGVPRVSWTGELQDARVFLPLAGEVRGSLGGDGGRVSLAGTWGTGPLAVEVALEGAPAPDVPWSVRVRRLSIPREGVEILLDQAVARGWLPPELRERLGAAGITLAGSAEGRGVRPRGLRASLAVARPRIGRSRWHLLEGSVEWRGSGRWTASGRLADAWGDGFVARARKRPGRPVRVRLDGRQVPSALPATFLPPVRIVEETIGPWLADASLDLVLDPYLPRGTGVVSLRALGNDPPRAFAAIRRGPTGRGSLLAAASVPGLSARARGLVAGGAAPVLDPRDVLSGIPHLHVEADTGTFSLVPLPVDLRGRVALDLEALREAGGAWTAGGGISWRRLVVAGRPVPDGQAEISGLPGGFAAETGTDHLRARLEVTGLPDAPRGRLRVRVRDLPFLERIAELRGTTPPAGLSGTVGGELELAGPLLEPAAWEGRATGLRLQVLGAGFTLETPEPGTVAIGGGRVAFEGPWRFEEPAGGSFALSGGAFLGPDGPGIDLSLSGSVPLGLLESLNPDLVALGIATIDLRVRGPVVHPRIAGRAEVSGGRLRHLPTGIGVDQVELLLVLEDGVARVERGTASLGGGDVTLAGTVELDGWRPGAVDLEVRARDVALTVPQDFLGRYDADLRIGGALLAPEVRGRIELLAGRYTGPLAFLSSGRRRRWQAPALRTEGPLSRIGLDVEFVADDSLVVRNDVAELVAATRIRATGTLASPEFAGTVTLLEGGRFSLRGLDYRILSGQVVLDDPRGQPVHLVARGETRIQGYRILFDLDASETSLDYHLSSIPALSRQDILLLLVTGRTSAELGSSGADQVGEAASTYFGSQLGELLIAGPARRYLGITQFQVAPSRVGPEARPSARVTLGKRIDERTMVIYSRDLSSEGNDLYRVERDLSRSFQVSLGKDPLGGVAIDLRWLRRLGAGKETEATRGRRLKRARFVGWPRDLRRPRLRRLGILRDVPDGRALRLQFRDAVRRELILGGYLEPRVRVHAEDRRRVGFTLVAEVEPGPRYRVEVVAPRRVARIVREQLADLWATTRFRPALLREAERVVLRGLARRGYEAAVVEIRYVPGDHPGLLVQVDPGPLVRIAAVRYEGVSHVPVADVEAQVLSRPGGLVSRRPVLNPAVLAEDARAIEGLYANRGYLAARVEPRIRLSVDGSTATVVFRVTEGPLARIGAVRVAGDWPTDVLGPATSHVELSTGDPFEQERVVRARRRLLRLLDDHGWYAARVEIQSTIRGDVVDVEFRVQPGERATVAAVTIEGIRHTRRKLVERNVPFEPGKPLRSADLHEAERNLFRLGLFREVEIDPEPVPGRPGEKNVVIRLTESPPKTVFLQGGYDTEEKVRTAVGFSAENVGGMGRIASFWLFHSSLRNVARVTFEDRHLRDGSLEGLLSLDRTREERDGFTLEGWSATVQLGTHPVEKKRWQVRYVLERSRFTDVTLAEDALDDLLWDEGRRIDQVRLGGLVLDLALDRRDDPFLPGDGHIWRGEIGLWTGILASEADFARGKLQWVGYRGWGKRFTGVLSVRLGVAVPFGGTARVPLSQRFFAGGADTVRGFARDGVGPRDRPAGHPVGGESLGIVNLEGRWRLGEHVELVAFHDLGNTWREAGDLGSSWRKTVGIGVRLRTPIGPVRLEYGHVLDRREGESPGRFYFSIGEPF